MRVSSIYGKDYRLPNVLNSFQEEMYVHLIDWKWENITREPGYYVHLGQKIPYDAILPDSMKGNLRIIYPDVVDALKQHREKFYFKLHQHFNHMASSQAANVNLFLPILMSPRVKHVFRKLRPDFSELATNKLDNGFRIEYWGPECGRGLLGDHTKRYGTDSDIAISYFNDKRELCLWLIEHKLTEKEFTECHGFTSPGKKDTHDCTKNFTELVKHMHYCYYHEAREFKYWEITAKSKDVFRNQKNHPECPFRGGMNQLWRNQLLGLAIEQNSALRYKHVHFSVVKHPRNSYLDKTIDEYKALTASNEKFSVFTSADVVNAAAAVHDTELHKWIGWYRTLYDL